ncbi:MAG: hypothetical protein BWY31_03255 [Lentisphaerae bacterium ADurb.Bin242]|nr:MAG: hypothetical protein BWY31_03255 [Lentisphaerae bacterium ADurb.Bin242]
MEDVRREPSPGEKLFPRFAVSAAAAFLLPYIGFNAAFYYSMTGPSDLFCARNLALFLPLLLLVGFAVLAYWVFRFRMDFLLFQEYRPGKKVDAILWAFASVAVPFGIFLLLLPARKKSGGAWFHAAAFAVLSTVEFFALPLKILEELGRFGDRGLTPSGDAVCFLALILLQIVLPVSAVLAYRSMTGGRLNRSAEGMILLLAFLGILSYYFSIASTRYADRLYGNEVAARRAAGLPGTRADAAEIYRRKPFNRMMTDHFYQLDDLVTEMDMDPRLHSSAATGYRRLPVFFEELRKRAPDPLDRMLAMDGVLKMRISFKTPFVQMRFPGMATARLLLSEVQVPRMEEALRKGDARTLLRLFLQSDRLSLFSADVPTEFGYVQAVAMEAMRLRIFAKMVNSGRFPAETLDLAYASLLETGRRINDSLPYCAAASSLSMPDAVETLLLDSDNADYPNFSDYRLLYPHIYYFLRMNTAYAMAFHRGLVIKASVPYYKKREDVIRFQKMEDSGKLPPYFAFLRNGFIAPLLENRYSQTLDCVQIAYAAERFRMKYGIYPNDLKKLTPEFLPSLPRDPWSGEAYRFRSGEINSLLFNGDGSSGERKKNGFLVYSPLEVDPALVFSVPGVYSPLGFYRLRISADRSRILPAFAFFPGDPD